MKEFFSTTFTDDLRRAEAIARQLGKMGVTWSCNAKANVPREALKVMRDNGLRLLLVGYESGNQQILYNIRKGMRLDVARAFAKHCHKFSFDSSRNTDPGRADRCWDVNRREGRQQAPVPLPRTRVGVAAGRAKPGGERVWDLEIKHWDPNSLSFLFWTPGSTTRASLPPLSSLLQGDGLDARPTTCEDGRGIPTNMRISKLLQWP